MFYVVRFLKMLFASIIDPFVRPLPKRVVFVTKNKAPLAGNLRVMLDAAMTCSEGYEIGFYCEGKTPGETVEYLRDRGVRVMERFSLENLFFILSSNIVVLSHSARDAYLPRRKQGRFVINVWHGVALKRIESLMRKHPTDKDYDGRLRLIKRNSRIYDAMLASNSVDRLVNALSFDVSYDKVHPVGLPRFEYMRPDYSWPGDLQIQRNRLQEKLKGRDLILYAPTFRDNGYGSLYDLLQAEDLERIRNFCKQKGVVFGVRPHPYRTHELQGICDDEFIIAMGSQEFAEPAILLSIADRLVVDYSSIWVDYLMRSQPIYGYVPDYENYVTLDRGFVHEFDRVFPGPLFRNWEDLLARIAAEQGKGANEQADNGNRDYACQMLLPYDFENINIKEDCLSLIRKASIGAMKQGAE